MKKLELILAENMRRFNTKNLHEDTTDSAIGILKSIIGFDINELGSPAQIQQYANELKRMDDLINNDVVPFRVVDKVMDLGDYYMSTRGSQNEGIDDVEGFIEYFTKYKKIMSKYLSNNVHEQLHGHHHPNADSRAYDAIIDILAEMSDLDRETVQSALEDVSSDDPTYDDPKYYERITEKIIPMLQTIANRISEKFNYYD